MGLPVIDNKQRKFKEIVNAFEAMSIKFSAHYNLIMTFYLIPKVLLNYFTLKINTI